VFVTFEGVEGAGKSTQLERLALELTRLGREVVVAREPGGTALGERVRAILLERDSARLDPRAESLLFAAARAQLIDEVIRPALDRGQDVLCDRYVHSSLAYQGAARGLGVAEVEAVNRWATAGVWPDLVVLLDLDPKVGLDRVERRAPTLPGADRFEGEVLDFHEAVARGFRDLAEADPGRFAVVDASAPADDVAGQVRAAVLSHLRALGAEDSGPISGWAGG
jgi:dTMP kinase